MNFSVLALDFDGTIAQHDTLELPMREAIADVRTRGIVTLLVTGRILSELQGAVGSLHFVDCVVAENGSVVYFPDSGHLSVPAPAIPEAFVAELRRQGIDHRAGYCLVDADARDAPRLLEVIRVLELPLVMIFNGGRVMTLAQGISKATGLRMALDTMRLSARNMLAIGDRENDHELLRLAEVGVAVQWGSAALRAAADFVIDGTGPPAVAQYVRHHAASQRLPVPARPRRTLRLGYTEDGQEFALAVRGRNVLVAGDTSSGKSWVAGLLCEQLILYGYCVCVIDPEGDYRSLEGLPGVTVLGGEDPPPSPRDLSHALRYPDRSVVIDLSRRSQDEKIEYVRSVLPVLNEIRRQTGLPHRIVIDEAHYFLHEPDARQLLDLERNGYTVVTYWASRLPEELLAATDVMIVTRESNPAEIDALRKWCSTCQPADPTSWSILGRLTTNQAIALPITKEAGGELRLFTLGTRLTPHVRHRQKYVDVPVSDSRAFVFAASGHGPAARARTLREFADELQQGAASRFDGYLRRADFSKWIEGVFGDYALGAAVRTLEHRHRVSPSPDTVPQVLNAIRARYDLRDEGLDLAS